jgi:serine/threonine-protein kinase
MVKTDTGRVMGTPMYMSPEQCRGAGSVDLRSDIYALGCVLYHMLVGRPPFVAEGAGEILAAHIHLHPLRPRALVPDLPAEVEAVTMKLLHKEPMLRYQTMNDVIVALNDLAESLAGARDEVEPSLAPSTRFETPTRRRLNRDVETMPTTLGQSSGESMDSPARSRAAWPVFAVVGAIAAVAIGAVALRYLRPGAETASVSPPPAAATASAPPAPVAATAAVGVPTAGTPEVPVADAAAPGDPAPAESESESAVVVVSIDSKPAGAKVYREADGVKLGTTPMTVRVLRGDGEAVFIVKRAGYRTLRVSATVDRDSEHRVVLERGSDGGGSVGSVAGPVHAPAARAPVSPPPDPGKPDPPPSRPSRDEALDPFGSKDAP